MIRTLLAALVLLLWAGEAAAASRPNVVILLSDNLGYGDLGVYGGGAIRGAPTPRIDALAGEGLRLTNFNVELSCTPSRSALMTGRYAVRSGTGAATPVPGIPQGMAPWEITIAELLRDAGYDTALFGKWHLGASEGRYPTDQGFDVWWGFPNSTGIVNFARSVGYPEGQLPPSNLYEGTSRDGVSVADQYDYEGRRFIDATIEQKAVEYLAQPERNRKPFFLMVSWSLVHHPSIPHPDFEGQSGAGRYADALLEHDHRVGRVLDAIDDNGLREKTLVIYASDNGPDRAEYPWVGDTGPYLGYLGSSYEGSVRTPMIARWPDHIPAGTQTNDIVAIHDLYQTIAAIAGVEPPTDRPIDGVDQRALLTGQGPSARESPAVLQSFHAVRHEVAGLQDPLHRRELGPARHGDHGDLDAAHLSPAGGSQGSKRHHPQGLSLDVRHHQSELSAFRESVSSTASCRKAASGPGPARYGFRTSSSVVAEALSRSRAGCRRRDG